MASTNIQVVEINKKLTYSSTEGTESSGIYKDLSTDF